MKKPSEYCGADKLQPLEIAIAYNLDFIEGNVLKYICRADHKGQKESDIVKAIDYARMLIHEVGRLVIIPLPVMDKIAERYCSDDPYLHDALYYFSRTLEDVHGYEVEKDIEGIVKCLEGCLNELKKDK